MCIKIMTIYKKVRPNMNATTYNFFLKHHVSIVHSHFIIKGVWTHLLGLQTLVQKWGVIH
jgi:hypothetical protein